MKYPNGEKLRRYNSVSFGENKILNWENTKQTGRDIKLKVNVYTNCISPYLHDSFLIF